MRIGALLRIAPEGLGIIALAAVIPLLALAAGFHKTAFVTVLCVGAIAAFFRDPERHTPSRSGVVCSGADGRVCDVAEDAALTCIGIGDERWRRVSVFMSPFNVHVNRASVSGEVLAVRHRAGEFRAAFSDRASENNERNLILIADAAGRRHAMVQVAGYFARRIVCRVSERQAVRCGERIGLIMFGSRVDHFLPAGFRVTVAVGDAVRAGETVIGESYDEPSA